MCRFTLYLGPTIRLASLVVEPKHSIIDQSFHSHGQEEPLNGDGFGVAWYAPAMSEEPALFRSVTPAWNNANLLELARVVESHVIFAHVRAATKHGGQSEANCHPFKSGRYAFMHNGDIGDFVHLRRPLIESLSDRAFQGIQGNTDSEHLFGVVVDELDRSTGTGVERLAGAMQAAVARITALGAAHGKGAQSYLNLALSDGESAVACRYTTEPDYDGESLFVHTGRVYVCRDGECRMLAPERGRGCVLVSSEPLSEDYGWQPISRNSMVLVTAEGTVSSRPIAT
ncbi:MAG TPA: class II glutamine amidotransferase [Planctomycetota bacterium]|nr:class II glutamine amidotransferase [Planctomycetota bacterium]